jgi:death-on-curing protein
MYFVLPSIDTVVEIHEIVIDSYGGLKGIPHPEQIEAAIMRPQHFMDYDEECDIHLVAAIILESITTFHAFADGNKRTALISMLMTYRMNGLELDFTLHVNEKLEKLVLDIADSQKRQTIKQLRTRLKKLIDEFSKRTK